MIYRPGNYFTPQERAIHYRAELARQSMPRFADPRFWGTPRQQWRRSYQLVRQLQASMAAATEEEKR